MAPKLREPSLAVAYPSAPRAAYTLAVLVLACLFAFVDVQVFALLVPSIKAALGVSDTRIGFIQGTGLSLAMGLASLPLGLLIDRNNRMRLVLLAVLGWSAFTVLSGLCGDFWQLFVCRIGVGVSEAGLYPLAYSLIADLYPPRQRGHATLVFIAGVLVTASTAIAVSGMTIGFIAAHGADLPWDLAGRTPWRLSFLAAGAPGLVLAALFLWTKEPARKHDAAAPPAAAGRSAMLAFTRANWRTIVRLSIGIPLSASAFDLLLFWMPTLLNRRYGISAEHAGQLLGLTVGVGTVLGTAMAAGLNSVLLQPRPELAPLRVLQLGTWATTLFLPVLLVAGDPTPLLCLWLVFAAFTYIARSIGPVLWLDITPNQLRGRFAIVNNLVSPLSTSLLMPLVGALSDRVFHDSNGLLEATCAVSVPCCLAAVLLLTGLKRSVLRMTSAQAVDHTAPTPAVEPLNSTA